VKRLNQVFKIIGKPARGRYGTLRMWAEELGMADAAKLLQEILDEEEVTDSALTKLADSLVNVEAEQKPGGLKPMCSTPH